MMRSLILAATMAALLLVGCKRSETVKEVAQEDLDFAVQSTQEITQASVGTISDPGAPIGLNRYVGGYFVYRYVGGYFVYDNEYIDLRAKGCVQYSGDSTDTDGDRVYNNLTIRFDNCNGVDTLQRDNKIYELKYLINGILKHIDSNDTNPFIFSSSWGNPFQFSIKITDLSTNEVYEFDNEQQGNISMENVQNNIYRIIRNLKYAKKASSCRNIQLVETTYVFLDQAQGWKPGDTLGNKTIKTWPIGKGKLTTCSGIDVNLSFEPIDTLRIAKCPNGSVGITSGSLVINLVLPTGDNKQFTKSFSCQQ